MPASGIPHAIQALDDGVEFVLVFDQGDFNEDNTLLVTEVFLHTPVRRHLPLLQNTRRLTKSTERGFGQRPRRPRLSFRQNPSQRSLHLQRNTGAE